jgi:amino acid adenylation domain-containing protein
VQPGDRVGIHTHKTIDTLAALIGALRCGAAYVPVDPLSPSWRAAYILNDCTVRAVIAESAFVEALEAEGGVPAGATVLSLARVGGGAGLEAALGASVPPGRDISPPGESLAYILYTSGSTGKPKGVMISHQAALDFVDWCSAVFAPTEEDRFSSHAPFHFDLSILDLFVPLKHGAAVTLIGEELGKEPKKLAAAMAEAQFTIWYSTPSILSLLAKYGRLDQYDFSSIRQILFAGEVFPVPALRVLTELLPAPRYFNLYGPTETNVCTWFEVPTPIDATRAEPYPIGRVCAHYRARVVDLEGQEVRPGETGELLIAGPGVMSGYWNLPEREAEAFLVEPSGTRWYRTGDLVVEQEGGVYVYHGRRDRMVKRRGYRIELGEIEAGLAAFPAVKEVAVIALPDPESGVRIKAYLASTDGSRPSVIELKRFCAERLASYMAPDAFGVLPALPRTSTDKIDYQGLRALG